MTTSDHIEARLIALEMLFRGMLSGLIAHHHNPMAEVDRMAEEFRSTAGFVRVVGGGDAHEERMRELIVARVDDIFKAVRDRALRDIEIQAAQAGRKN